ncbi:uncharacterized protein L201_007870 [Kwoniella dendrophila CBS 6074]|uniref:Zn(2)-C6 fungal-type domain-containing protein n=1 Tax=Kwoniella dendrophila CBS 6074 TaxID=1295534 RepID=A0AAX4K7Y0_9TREE
MPKEDVQHSHAAPLKRGDACLYCRKRRIKCSADKPTCANCQKSNRECIYDSGKPVSRVKQLEEKVAQLETLLSGSIAPPIPATSSSNNGNGENSNTESRRESQSSAFTTNIPTHPPLNHHSSSQSSGISSSQNYSSIDPSPQIPQNLNSNSNMNAVLPESSSTSYGYTVNTESFDIDMYETMLTTQPEESNLNFGNFPSFGGAFFSGNSNGSAQTGATPNFFGMNNPQANNPAGIGMGGMGNNVPAIESLFDFNMLDPNYMNMLNSFESTFNSVPPPSTTSMNPNYSIPSNPPQQPISQNPNQNQPSNTSQSDSFPAFMSTTIKNQVKGNQDAIPFVGIDSARAALSASKMDYNHHNNDPAPLVSVKAANTSTSTVPSPSLNSGPYTTAHFINSCNPQDVSGIVDYMNRKTNSNTISDKRARVEDYMQQAQLPPPPPSNAADALLTEIDEATKPTKGPDRLTFTLGRENPRDISVEKPNTSSSSNSGVKFPQQWVTGITDSSPKDAPAGTGTKGAFDKKDDEGILVGGWFDAHDLPKVARDHLLDLFFSGMRLFGQEIHVPRFMASLTLPAHKRPHPCLLYTMYTVASRISDSPPIRQLETHFYKIASSQLEESIGMADRLMDATRASTILAVYKFSKARYHEGWMMTGQAARLAVSCGLHQITSSVYKPSILPNINTDLVGIMRHRSYVLPPPKDAIDLGERIWCFWSIYVTDRCGSISTQWPPAISDATITTPFPRPLHEYELGLVTEQDDHYSVQSIYKPSLYYNPLPHYAETTLISVRLRSISILERASKLMYQPPEEGWERNVLSSTGIQTSNSSNYNSPSSNIDEYLISQITSAAGFSPSYQQNQYTESPNSSSSTGTSTNNYNNSNNMGNSTNSNRLKEGWTRTARIRTPRAFEEVKQALLKIENDLPPEWRVEWWKWDGKIQEWHFSKPRKDLLTLQFVLGCAWMFLYDVFSFNAENNEALNVAKRLTVTVKFVAKEAMTSDLDIFIAMTWSFISKILIREMKRLQSIGDYTNANDLEPEIQTLVNALKEFGQRYTIGKVQALRTERYHKTTPEENDYLFKRNKQEEESQLDGDYQEPSSYDRNTFAVDDNDDD